MRRVIAAVGLVVALLIPLTYIAASQLDSPEAMARWAGCKAEVIEMENQSVLSSYYAPLWEQMYIGMDNEDVPLETQQIIIFHEIGHCLQDQEIQIGPLLEQGGRQMVELDADRRAADLACRRGQDGRRMLREAFLWAKKTFGYDGDDSHGTLAERISQGDKALYCTLQHNTYES